MSKYLENVIIGMMAVIVIVLSWVRLSLGIALSDEAYYVAEARLLAQGAVPFVNNWTQTPGHTIIYFWLVPLFENITGGTEGLLLYMRRAYFIFKLLMLSCVFLLLRKYIRPQTLVLFLLTIVVFAPFNLYMFSYNSMPPLFILLSAAFILYTLLSDSKSILFACLAGICMTLCCLTNPPQIIVAIVFGFLFLACWIKFKKGQPILPPLTYIISGLISAIAIITILIIAGGGIEKLYNGIHILLSTPYFELQNRPLAFQLDTIKIFLTHVGHLLLYICVAIVVLALPLFFYRRYCGVHQPVAKKSLILIACLLGLMFFVFYCLGFMGSKNMAMQRTFDAGIVILPIILFCLIDGKTGILKNLCLVFLWIPFIIYFIVSATFSAMILRNMWYVCFIANMSSVLFFSFAVQSVKTTRPGDWYSEFIKKIRPSTLICIWACILIASALLGSFTSTYRDVTFNIADAQITKGVYKGIYTSEHNAAAILQLEASIQKLTNANDCILFRDAAPIGYLMTNASFCTPSTWDMTLYTNGFNDDSSLHAYFKLVDKMPNKIIYVNWGKDRVQSIDKEDYIFNNFVFENYRLAYEDNKALFPIKVFERKN